MTEDVMKRFRAGVLRHLWNDDFRRSLAVRDDGSRCILTVSMDDLVEDVEARIYAEGGLPANVVCAVDDRYFRLLLVTPAAVKRQPFTDQLVGRGATMGMLIERLAQEPGREVRVTVQKGRRGDAKVSSEGRILELVSG